MTRHQRLRMSYRFKIKPGRVVGSRRWLGAFPSDARVMWHDAVREHKQAVKVAGCGSL
jgi:hypothetical protein